MNYFLGLDLGQAADYSALAILEAGRGGRDATYRCRHLQRWPLRTPYPEIVRDVVRMARSDELQAARRRLGTVHGTRFECEQTIRASLPVLAVDATGVGPPVVDLLRAALNSRPATAGIFLGGGESDEYGPPQDVWLKAIQITGGASVTYDNGFIRVPKRDLVSVAQVALQTGRLKIAPELAEAATLTRELSNFQVKINVETAHDSYGAWREGTHDDLVLALALALWSGVSTPEPEEAGYSFGYLRGY